MSAALDAIYRALEPLRLYALRQNSLIDRELAAYDAAFAAAELALAEIARQAFVQTAGGSALSIYEKTVGLAPGSGMTEDARRELVLYRLGSAPSAFDYTGMAQSILAAGMEASLIEDIPGEALTVRCIGLTDPSLDLDSLTARVNAILPAHLNAMIDIGVMTWDMFEERELDWDAWDAADFTWSEFDINGHSLI